MASVSFSISLMLHPFFAKNDSGVTDLNLQL